MKTTITLWTVASSRAEAKRLVINRKWRRLGSQTFFGKGAARLTVKDIARVPENKPQRIYPVTITVEVGQAAKKGEE